MANTSHNTWPLVPFSFLDSQLQTPMGNTDLSTMILQLLRDRNPWPEIPMADTNVSTMPFKPFRFLDLPPEIRFIIYELVIGVDKRFHIDCGHTDMAEEFPRLAVSL